MSEPTSGCSRLCFLILATRNEMPQNRAPPLEPYKVLDRDCKLKSVLMIRVTFELAIRHWGLALVRE